MVLHNPIGSMHVIDVMEPMWALGSVDKILH